MPKIKYKHKQKPPKKTKPVKPFEGLDKIFKEKVKRSSTAHKARGSTWLKEPPKRISPKKSKKAGRLSAEL